MTRRSTRSPPPEFIITLIVQFCNHRVSDLLTKTTTTRRIAKVGRKEGEKERESVAVGRSPSEPEGYWPSSAWSSSLPLKRVHVFTFCCTHSPERCCCCWLVDAVQQKQQQLMVVTRRQGNAQCTLDTNEIIFNRREEDELPKCQQCHAVLSSQSK